MTASNVTFEIAKSSDLNEIAAMSGDLIEVGLEQRWSVARLARVLQHPFGTLLVAKLEDQLVGFALMLFEDDHAHLALLAVKDNYQFQGLGRRMNAWLEKSAKAAGVKRIFVEVRALNHGARAFYRRLRYRESKLLRGYYQGKEDAVRMVRRFKKPSQAKMKPYYAAIDNLLESL